MNLIITRKVVDGWEHVSPVDIKQGDVFQVAYPDGVFDTRPIEVDGETVYTTEFVATADALTDTSGEWKIPL
jgi:hypothetical protein